MSTAVAVCVRQRPPSTANGEAATPMPHEDTFRAHFGADADQHTVYASPATGRLPEAAVSFATRGAGGLVFAYGQTGSGKTHTMLGPPGFLSEPLAATGAPPASWGIFPRFALDTLRALPPGAVLTLSVTEVYMERVYDLLNNRVSVAVDGVGTKAVGRGVVNGNEMTRDANGKWVNPFLARDIVHAAVVNPGTTKYPIATPADVVAATRLVEATRTAVGHNLNERSSRSHAVIKLVVSFPGTRKADAAFAFVDLAGSERIGKSGVDGDGSTGASRYAVKGNVSMDIPQTRLSEAKSVNMSLTALSRVMVTLSKRQEHVPFRDSVLTIALRPLLEAAAAQGHLTLLLAVRSGGSNCGESEATMRFGRVVAAVPRFAGGARRGSLRGTREAYGAAAVAPEPASPAAGAAQDPKAMADGIRRALAEVSQRKAALAATGGAGGYNTKENNPGVIESFKRNQALLDENKLKARDFKQERLERKTRGEPTEAVEKARKVAAEKVEIYTGMVYRQINAGVWQPPSAAYTAAEQEEQLLQKALADVERRM